MELHRPRIAFFIQNLSLAGGGAERVLSETANAMFDLGFDVHVAYYQRGDAPLIYPLRYGIHRVNLYPARYRRVSDKRATEMAETAGAEDTQAEVVVDTSVQADAVVSPAGNPGPITRLKRSLRPMLRGLRMARAIRRYLRSTKPDAVIPFLPPAFTATTIGGIGLGIPVIASTHNAPEQDFRNPLKYSSNPIDMWLRFNVLRLARRILVLLPEYRDYYPPSMRTKVEVVPNPVRTIEPPADVRRKNTILAVGRLTTVKRFDLLIRAWAPLQHKFPDWSIDIWGIGPEEEMLRRLIDELDVGASVHLRGYTAAIQSEYFTHAWLAHPAEYEGFPLAVTEALSMELPVIGFSDCSGLNRLVKDGENGILVDPGQDRVAAFSATLERALADASLAARLGANGPSSVAQYSPESVYATWERVILAAIGGTKPAARAQMEVAR